MRPKILIVEDQFIEANNLQKILKRVNYEVCSIARSVPVALGIIEAENPDMVLLDIMLKGDLTGIDLAGDLRRKGIAFVYLSANSNKEILDAAKATQPYGFLVKPFREKDVLVMLDVAWYLHGQNQKINFKNEAAPALEKITSASVEVENIIAESPAMLDLLNKVKVVSKSDCSVLIMGESGTGKELVAQSVHRLSNRHSKPLVTVNCASLPANLIESELFGHERGSFTGAINKRIGKFELADKGTIFLDEIGELPMDLQVKFLRVLQEREIEPIGGRLKKIDVRVIAATNRDLENEVAAGRFRIDLYYRLSVFPMTLPPLRERKADILPLANHFLRLYSGKAGKLITGFSDRVIKMILNYSWPGNIRELEHLIERSALLTEGKLIEEIYLPSRINNSDPKYTSEDGSIKTIDENERDYILKILKHCKGKITGQGGAAGLLGVPPGTLHSKMKRLGIKKDFFS